MTAWSTGSGSCGPLRHGSSESDGSLSSPRSGAPIRPRPIPTKQTSGRRRSNIISRSLPWGISFRRLTLHLRPVFRSIRFCAPSLSRAETSTNTGQEHAGIQRITAHGTAASPRGKGVRRSQSRAWAISVAPIGSQEGRFAPAARPCTRATSATRRVEAEKLTNDDSLRRFVPRRAPSPWLHENGKWWPKPQPADGGAAPALG